MQGIFQKENTDKALKYGIYRHLPTYEKIIRNLVSFFKKNMGMSFLEYINEVRLTHIYQDLIHTDTPISILTEENGFSNQKLFNRLFKELYGCTPSSVRMSASASAGRNGLH